MKTAFLVVALLVVLVVVSADEGEGKGEGKGKGKGKGNRCTKEKLEKKCKHLADPEKKEKMEGWMKNMSEECKAICGRTKAEVCDKLESDPTGAEAACKKIKEEMKEKKCRGKGHGKGKGKGKEGEDEKKEE